jgi:phenylpropionate dioxygenase-like ring-hydroxylating dioxygenase large terminal subunit
MFIHQRNLRHVLRPDQYYSEQQHRAELERLFLPGWHFLCTTTDLPRHGDFLTTDFLGRPLLLRNEGGTVHAFLNVCPHRHCMLTHQPRGSDPRFRCQYHGWEYTADGRTGRIPDAQCFRPLERENARLHRFRTATCGELVFVSAADDGPTLRDQLGPLYPTCAESFAPPFRQVWRWQADYAANWKIPVENSLESYHIPCLHPKTFKNFPKEENIDHELNERYTSYRTVEMEKWVRDSNIWTAKRLGVSATNVYTHYHVHPNLIFVTMDLMRMAQLVVPLSPTTSRTLVWVYSLRGKRNGPLARLLWRTTSWVVASIAKRVLQEDMPIFADVQRGLEASVHSGILGTREERVYMFQDYVARSCGGAAADPVAPCGPAAFPAAHPQASEENGAEAGGAVSAPRPTVGTCIQ